MTYFSCVDHPIQCLFFSIAARLYLKVFGGDAKDAYAHSPGSNIPTYMTIDDAYSEWYRKKESAARYSRIRQTMGETLQ